LHTVYKQHPCKTVHVASPVYVEGALQLFTEGLHLSALLQQLAPQAGHLR
jgi:hypothetical protein